MLRVSELRAGYGGAPVLLGVDFVLRDGEILALLGRNGAGKSTLLKAVMGLLRAERGTIELDGRDITRLQGYRRARLGLGYVPQGRGIFPRLTVRDNIRVAAVAAGQSVQQRMEEVLETFPVLQGKLDARGEALSGGQQQILALGRALATGPRIMLLDEPSEGIQPSIVADMAHRVLQLHVQRGITVLIVEQNLDFVTRLAERAYVMRKGQIVREVPVDRVAHDVEIQREYMGV